MTRRFDVCVVGSANLDLVATAPELPRPGRTVLGTGFAEHAGGKGLNQAVAAARAGARTAFCGAVGDDDAARRLLHVMDQDGVNRDSVRTVPDVPTGRALIGVSASGENSIIVVPGANACLQPVDVLEAAASAATLLVQREVPDDTVRAALEAARAAGVITILNPAPASAIEQSTLALCDLIVPNEHEVELLGGAERLLAGGATAVIVTLGARGAMLLRQGLEPHLVAPFSVAAIDTTAAGDACCGALAAALSAGVGIPEALRFACAAGALATTRAGAVPSLPARSEIDRLINGAG